jgi:hypothetical protein
MRITLSGAMRARDVSRPSDEQLAAAAKREEAAGRASMASRPAHAPAHAPAGAPGPRVPAAPTEPRQAADDAPAPRRRRRRRG